VHTVRKELGVTANYIIIGRAGAVPLADLCERIASVNGVREQYQTAEAGEVLLLARTLTDEPGEIERLVEALVTQGLGVGMIKRIDRFFRASELFV
jgi:hypothetical protein